MKSIHPGTKLHIYSHQLIMTCLLILLTSMLTSAFAATLPAATSWLGNSLGGANNKWVQNSITSMYVSPDGTYYTASPSDSGGRQGGIYQEQGTLIKEGGAANFFFSFDRTSTGIIPGPGVAGNTNYLYLIVKQEALATVITNINNLPSNPFLSIQTPTQENWFGRRTARRRQQTFRRGSWPASAGCF